MEIEGYTGIYRILGALYKDRENSLLRDFAKYNLIPEVHSVREAIFDFLYKTRVN